MSGPGFRDGLVITADTRRRWSAEEKRAIVAEAARTTSSISQVARRHGISPSLLFRWRRDFAGADRTQASPTPIFIPVALPGPAEAAARPEPRSGLIEIELLGGRRIRVDAWVETAALMRILAALEGR